MDEVKTSCKHIIVFESDEPLFSSIVEEFVEALGAKTVMSKTYLKETII
ncbi:MAG TPA: hypothetical protein VFM82_03560 [Flavobacteriaceae bacterium]|nr:hypothetical protein [Flavobacteriaceae bacterium]